MRELKTVSGSPMMPFQMLKFLERSGKGKGLKISLFYPTITPVQLDPWMKGISRFKPVDHPFLESVLGGGVEK